MKSKGILFSLYLLAISFTSFNSGNNAIACVRADSSPSFKVIAILPFCLIDSNS